MIADFETGPALPHAITPGGMVEDMQDLPLAPKVLPRLKRLLSDPNSTLHEIARLIRLDPAIAARVLQVANSAYYSKGVRCFTVDEAVKRVGFSQIYELVAYAVASQVLVRPLEVYDLEADDLWRNSVCCALAAEVLAERTGQDRDVAYTAGLLHAVGMVVIDGWALKHGRDDLKLRDTGFPRQADESEIAAFGFTQAETGAVLLESWDFPSSISEPVRWQQSPDPDGEHGRMTSLLYASRWLRSSVCRGAFASPGVPAATLRRLGLAHGALYEIAGEVEARFAAVSSLLENVDEEDTPAQPAQRFPKTVRSGQ